MKKYGFKLTAIVLVLFLWLSVIALGRGRYDFGNNFSGILSATGMGTGVLDEYGFTVADIDGYGMARVGCFAFGITNYNESNMDLDGTVVLRNLEGPKTGIYEFVFEEGNGNTRFAIPESGVGNATYNARSMIHAGPAVQNDGIATFAYWQSQGIFHNLVGDTAGDGADVGIQHNLEVEDTIYSDKIQEGTPGAGVTVSGDINIGDAGGFSGVKFNPTSTQLEFWIDGSQVGHIGIDGAYVDDV